MIVAGIILAGIMLPIIWVVFMPVNITVNTLRNVYEIKQLGTIAIHLHPGETQIFRMRVFGFLLDTKRREKVRHVTGGKVKSKVQRRRTRKSIRAWTDLLYRMVQSFRCKRFICSIDFDDVVLNAQLFPLNYLISRGPVVLNVNFENKCLLDIWIQARLHRMVWAFMRFYLTK